MPPARILLVAGLGLALAVAAYAVLAPSALPRLVEQRRDNDALEHELDAQRDHNRGQERELVLLKDEGPAGKIALEKAARSELGFVHKDEVVLVGLPVGAADAGPGAPKVPADAQ